MASISGHKRRFLQGPLLPDGANYTRRLGKEPEEPDEPSTSRPKRMRRLVQDAKELSRIDNYDLQLEARELFYSNDPLRLQSLVLDFAASSNQNPQAQVKALWDYCARKSPNALSLQLARLLHSPLPPGLRDHVVSLLHRTLNEIHGRDMSRIHHQILLSLKPMLFHALQMENSAPTMANLSEIVANVASRVFEQPDWSWDELLEYIVSSLHMDLESRQEIALKMLLGLPEADPSEECPQLDKFWESNYESFCERFWQLFDSPNLNIQALTFDASARLVRMLLVNFFVAYKELEPMLTRMTNFLQTFHMGGQTDFVLPRVRVLADLAKDHVEFFLNDLNAVFQCVLQIAETADGNTVLLSEAIKVLKELDGGALDQMSEFMMNISEEDNRRLIKVSVHMMFCISDDPNWYDVNILRSEYAGTTESYHLGRFLLDRICFGGREAAVISLGIEIIPTYLIAEDWQARHAAVIAFAAIGEGCSSEMIRYSEHAERLIDISLNDRHPRVQWAAVDAIRCLSGDTVEGEPANHVQYLNKFLHQLVTIVSYSHFTRLQVHAALVIRFLIKRCSDDEILSVLEDLVSELIKLLKEDEQKLQEEAMETLKSVSSSFPVYFCRYYYETMDSLKSLLFDTSTQTKLLVRVKSIECMSNITLGFEQIGSRDGDAVQAMEVLTSIGENFEEAEHSIKIEILKALSQFCKLPELVIGNFVNSFVPILIQSLKNTKSDVSTDYLSVNIERALACEIISYCAGRFREKFAPWAPKVAPLLTPLISCPDSESRMTSLKAIPNLLLSSQDSQQSKSRSFMVNFLVKSLVEALHEEFDRETSIAMLETLNGCIQISGPDFTPPKIQLIADEIKHTMGQQSLANMELESGEEAETPDEVDEQNQGEEMIQSANCLMSMINTLKSTFLPYVDELVPTVALLWGNAFPDRVKAVAFSIFNLLAQDYPDKLKMYHDTYATILFNACLSESPKVQEEAARGIGFCAMLKGHIFKFEANVAINSLYILIGHGNESDRAKTYDAAVSAIGKICEFCRDSINGPEEHRRGFFTPDNNTLLSKLMQILFIHAWIGTPKQEQVMGSVVPAWLNFLPLRGNFMEAKYAHELLCKMLERSDQDLLGPDHQNLPKVVEVLNEILSNNDHLATEETTSKIISLLNRYGTMP